MSKIWFIIINIIIAVADLIMFIYLSNVFTN